jgi:hypothetical protein
MSKIENIDDVAATLAAAVLNKTTFKGIKDPLATEEIAQISVNLFFDIKRQLENKNK